LKAHADQTRSRHPPFGGAMLHAFAKIAHLSI
jgi:hypothetical protein